MLPVALWLFVYDVLITAVFVWVEGSHAVTILSAGAICRSLIASVVITISGPPELGSRFGNKRTFLMIGLLRVLYSRRRRLVLT